LYNGSSDVQIERNKFPYQWKHAFKYNYTLRASVYTWRNKSAPPYDFEISTGSNYMAASRVFVDYIINSKYGIDLAKWGEDMVRYKVYLI
jgi:hypothetical protein